MTIFITGIHGVGKTYLAKPAAQQLFLVYATASQLIREERGSMTWDKNKKVDEVAENQAALVRAVNRIKSNGDTLMLDGHLVLRKSVNQHERLPETVDFHAKLTHHFHLILTHPCS
jgi:adenylate kinase